MTRIRRVWAIGVAMTLAAVVPAGTVLAQAPQKQAAREQQTPPPGGRGARPAAGRALPPITTNMNQQPLQAWIDAYAIVQAQKDLQLTDEQYSPFVSRLLKMQDVRRRQVGERRRLLGQLNGLMQQGQGAEGSRDEAILASVKALDDQAQRSSAEVRQAYQEIDAILTPWQRGRYRMFEEQLERRKVDLLSKIGAPAAPAPGRGGDGK